ncbi:teicoplanin resistance protein VanZ, partial [Burkholderia contaminans]
MRRVAPARSRRRAISSCRRSPRGSACRRTRARRDACRAAAMSATGTPRASPLARQAFAAYAALVVYASLYPFGGWVSLGIGPFDYLFAPMQRYVTAFDVVTNVVG